MAPGDIVDIGSEIASVWSNQLSGLPNSVGVSLDAYSCCMMQGRRRQIVSGMFVVGISIVVGLVSGCIPASKPGFDSPAPSKRLDAIVDASGLEDNESLVRLVEKLRSAVPAERMFAIRSLEIRTGSTLGYHHAGHDWERIEAFGRWIEYLEAQGIETSLLVEDQVDEVVQAEDDD
ncbi:hypothetical protein COB72_07550 [bacterium]|nr:MAG: hypothetical protein COB72_07550 [bacterium]